jgi:transposase
MQLGRPSSLAARSDRAAIRVHVFAADKNHSDDTAVPVLEPGLDRTKTGRLWVYVRDDRRLCGEAPPAAAYFYSPDRTAARPAAHMSPARTKPGPIIEVACWAHARRGFFEEWEHRKSPTPKEALDRIAAIYAIEARAAPAPISERVELRRKT